MGRFDKLAKYLGLAAEKYGDDAAKVLEKVDSAELADALPPAERGDYIKALTEIYGDESKRRKAMTFPEKLSYTGTDREIRNLDPNINKNSLMGQGTYLTSDPKHANQFTNNETGNIMPVYVKEGKYLNVNENEGLSDELVDKLVEKMGKGKYSPKELEQLKLDIKALPNATKETALAKKIYDGDVTKLGKDLNKEGILGKKHYSKFPIDNPTETTLIKDPSNMRSQFAAFDPRFKDSPLLMAGAAAIPQVDMNPIPSIKQGLEYYEKAKESLTKPLAKQLNIAKNPEDEAAFNDILKMGLDPANLVPGVSGAGLGAIQALTPSSDEMKIQALKKLSNRER
jgi:hypothetical protein